MEAVSKGAQQAGGLTVGIMPSLDGNEANPYVELRITTGLKGIRNVLIIRSSDAVIMIAGGRGTLNELTIAYGRKPVIILEGSGGWSDRIRGAAIEGLHLDERRDGQLRYASSPQEAVGMAFDLVAAAEDAPSP
jgi:uncharacterized protein (TIGR00725 family)